MGDLSTLDPIWARDSAWSSLRWKCKLITTSQGKISQASPTVDYLTLHVPRPPTISHRLGSWPQSPPNSHMPGRLVGPTNTKMPRHRPAPTGHGRLWTSRRNPTESSEWPMRRFRQDSSLFTTATVLPLPPLDSSSIALRPTLPQTLSPVPIAIPKVTVTFLYPNRFFLRSPQSIRARYYRFGNHA